MERGVRELASRDFFLKTLDRPHYPDGVGRDNRNTPIDDNGNRLDQAGRRIDDDEGNLVKPAKSQPQVSNAAPTALASARKP
jgi:hypothetical protein